MRGDQEVGRGKNDAAAVEGPSQLRGALPNLLGGGNVTHNREGLLKVPKDVGVTPTAQYFQDNHAAGGEIVINCKRAQLAQRIEVGPRAVDVVVTVRKQEGSRHRVLVS